MEMIFCMYGFTRSSALQYRVSVTASPEASVLSSFAVSSALSSATSAVSSVFSAVSLLAVSELPPPHPNNVAATITPVNNNAIFLFMFFPPDIKIYHVSDGIII